MSLGCNIPVCLILGGDKERGGVVGVIKCVLQSNFFDGSMKASFQKLTFCYVQATFPE